MRPDVGRRASRRSRTSPAAARSRARSSIRLRPPPPRRLRSHPRAPRGAQGRARIDHPCRQRPRRRSAMRRTSSTRTTPSSSRPASTASKASSANAAKAPTCSGDPATGSRSNASSGKSSSSSASPSPKARAPASAALVGVYDKKGSLVRRRRRHRLHPGLAPRAPQEARSDHPTDLTVLDAGRRARRLVATSSRSSSPRSRSPSGPTTIASATLRFKDGGDAKIRAPSSVSAPPTRPNARARSRRPNIHTGPGARRRRLRHRRRSRRLRSRGPRSGELAALRRRGDDEEICASPAVRITHPSRVMYPELGLTKLAVAHFYEAIAPRILPGLVDRPT